MIDRCRVPGAVTRAVERRKPVDRVVGGLRGRHQEVALVPVDQQEVSADARLSMGRTISSNRGPTKAGTVWLDRIQL